MSRWTGPLSITSLDIAGKEWKLNENLVYERHFLGSGKVIVVPAGFVTDGASIPWPLRGFLPPWGRYSRAAVLHDRIIRARLMPVKEADSVFHEAMIASGVSKPLAWIMWAAVRLRAIIIGYVPPVDNRPTA